MGKVWGKFRSTELLGCRLSFAIVGDCCLWHQSHWSERSMCINRQRVEADIVRVDDSRWNQSTNRGNLKDGTDQKKKTMKDNRTESPKSGPGNGVRLWQGNEGKSVSIYGIRVLCRRTANGRNCYNRISMGVGSKFILLYTKDFIVC